MREDETYAAEALIDLAPAPPLPDKNDLDGPGGPGNSGHGAHGGGGASGGGFQYPPQQPHQQQQQPPYYQQHMGPYNYPPAGGMAYPAGGAMAYPPPPSSMPPNSSANGSMYPNEKSLLNFEEGPPPYFPPDLGSQSAANAPRYLLKSLDHKLYIFNWEVLVIKLTLFFSD